MTPHKSTATRGRDGPLVEVVEVAEVGEVLEMCSTAGTTPGSLTVGAAGNAAAGRVTAAGGATCSRDWIVPVTSPATSATFQSSSDAAGSSRPRRVTSHTRDRKS